MKKEVNKKTKKNWDKPSKIKKKQKYMENEKRICINNSKIKKTKIYILKIR